MFYGYGRGVGRGTGTRGGMGFGFRGSSPPWPYVGRGRGGLPRCAYFLSGAGQSPYPFSSQASTKEQEISLLKEQLEQIESRIRELEGESK